MGAPSPPTRPLSPLAVGLPSPPLALSPSRRRPPSSRHLSQSLAVSHRLLSSLAVSYPLSRSVAVYSLTVWIMDLPTTRAPLARPPASPATSRHQSRRLTLAISFSPSVAFTCPSLAPRRHLKPPVAVCCRLPPSLVVSCRLWRLSLTVTRRAEPARARLGSNRRVGLQCARSSG